MNISHPAATWTLQYEDGRGTGPQKLQLEGKTLFSFMHCRIDGASDDALESTRAHHFHKGGLALFEGAGVFTQGPRVQLRQTHRIAANTVRITYDLSWPKATSLAKGVELGSVVLAPSFSRFFVVTSDTTEPQWRNLPAPGEPPVSLSPIPEAIVLENPNGLRFEYGLGDDLWRWANGLNGEYLHATGRLELSRTSGGRVSLRRWMAECDPELEAKLAEAATAKLQQAVLKLRQELDHEDNTPLPTAPVSQPAQRDYRFTSYFAWSQPELLPKITSEIEPKALKFNKQCAIDRTALEECGPAPAIRLDLAALAGQSHACRTDGACCWESNQAQNLFRRIIRQLASYTRSGTLVLDNLHPGWCDIGTHENRKHNARHWDLCAILDQIAWTRQALGPGWNLHVPQHGLWAELPSLACLGADNGFRVM